MIDVEGSHPVRASGLGRAVTRLVVAPITTLNRYTGLLGLHRAVLIYGLYLCSGEQLVPPARVALLLLAANIATGCLLGYNNYRGRNEDELSLRRRFRPLAGAGRVLWVEIVLALAAVLGVVLPLAVGAPLEAATNAAAVALYIALFENRYSRRPIALLKPLSACVTVTVAVYGVERTIGAPMEAALALTAFLGAWRWGWELTMDCLDRPADERNGIVTPATTWRISALVRSAVLVGAALVVGGVVLLGGLVSGVRLGGVLGLGVVMLSLIAIGYRFAATHPEHGAFDLLRQAFHFVATMGIASVLVAVRGWPDAIAFTAILFWKDIRYFAPRDVAWLSSLRAEPSPTLTPAPEHPTQA